VGYGYGIEKKAIATGLNLWSGIFSKIFGLWTLGSEDVSILLHSSSFCSFSSHG